MRLTYANVTATLALFVALGGISYATIKLPRNSVGKAQLKKNSVVSSKVKNRTLRARDFKAGELPKGAEGERGDKGDRGDQGPQGAAGSGTPFDGASAGGDLVGTYPDPTIAGGAVTPTKIGTLPAAFVAASGSQPVSGGGVPQDVAWSTEYFDTDNIFGGSGTQLTIRTDGKYLITAGVAWGFGTSGFREATILWNGGPLTTTTIPSISGMSSVDQNLAAIWSASAGNTVDLSIAHNNTDPVDIGNWGTFLAVHWLGP